MLEPREIRTHHFTQVRQGYKPEDVDAFLRQTADSYEQTRSELEQLRVLAEQTAEKLKKCIAERDSISRVLAKAEIMADNIRKDANDEARSLIATAERKAKECLHDARLKADEAVREATSIAQDRLKKAAETADKVEATSRERADKIERAAEQKAYAALHSLEEQRAAIRREADELSASSARFKLDMINAYEHQLRVLRQLPDEILLSGTEQSSDPDIHKEEPAAVEHIEPTMTEDLSLKMTETEATASEEMTQHAADGDENVKAKDNETRYSGYFSE